MIQTQRWANDFTMKPLINEERLRLLNQLSLLQDKEVRVYDQLTELASTLIHAPVALMSMVETDRVYFKSHTGLPEPWRTQRAAPLSHAFCQHVVISNQPLIISDARENELVKDSLAIPDLNAIGYMGMPLTLINGATLGSFCVIDNQVRDWTPTEIAIMQQLAGILICEFEARIQVNLYYATLNELYEMQANILKLIDTLEPEQGHSAVLEQIRMLRTDFRLL